MERTKMIVINKDGVPVLYIGSKEIDGLFAGQILWQSQNDLDRAQRQLEQERWKRKRKKY